MNLVFPQGYAPSAESVKSKLTEAEAMISRLRAASFDPDDINKIVENAAATDSDLALACASLIESCTIEEAIVKHVDSRGTITRTKDRKTRERMAFQTTGLTKAKRRQIARKAVKTKRANPSIGIKAQRKTKKAMKKRKALGLQ